ncbi:MAG TPA: HEAT repeat domain-containing protein [Desulfomonilaceae bacterium]|nr:HEAT repeat domain-containing protein [Desulfomonilaceae bacterium]
MKTQAVPALQKIAALYDKAEPMDRIEIVDALVAIDTHGDHALPVLIKALKEPDPQDRKEALMSVLRFRSKADEFLGPLSDSLSDSDLENRLLTIGIIKGLGEKGVKAVPKLIVLIDDPDLRVRNAAISALGAFPPEPNIFQALDKAMKDRDSRVRMTAIGILRRIGTADPQKASVILEQALAAETNDQTKRSISSALDSLKKPQPRASDHMK